MPQHFNAVGAVMMGETGFAKVFEEGAHLLAAALQTRFFALPEALHLVDHKEGVAANVEAGGAGVGAGVAQAFEECFEGGDQGVIFGFIVGGMIAKT